MTFEDPMLDPIWMHRTRQLASTCEESIRQTRVECCPKCEGLASVMADLCPDTRKGDASEFEGAPVCKWAPEKLVLLHSEQERKHRIDKLLKARAVSPRIAEAVAGRDRPPPPPQMPYIGFGDDLDNHERGRHAVERLARGEGERRAVFLAGGTGTGKTVMAAWGFTKLRGAAWIHATAASNLDDWKAIQHTLNAPALVIDDLGRERDGAAKFATETLAEVMTSIFDQGRLLIVTTNLSYEDFRNRYGARLYSRVCQQAWWQSIGSVDLRRAKS